MRTLCGRIVEAFGTEWTFIGWFLIACNLFLPFFIPASASVVLLIVLGLLFFWGVVDLVDQCVPWWMLVIGIVMLTLGRIQGMLTVACVVIYMLKVRE